MNREFHSLTVLAMRSFLDEAQEIFLSAIHPFEGRFPLPGALARMLIGQSYVILTDSVIQSARFLPLSMHFNEDRVSALAGEF